jgi:uncharacterized lipoprotein YddW (UPF0748 family)
MKAVRLVLGCLFFLLVAVSLANADTSSPTSDSSRKVEIRAVWVDKESIPKTERGVREMVRSYARAGINIMHPEVIYNGYSAYPSAFLKQMDLWNGVDVLGIMIDEAHKNGIEVHPWVWVFRAGNVKDRGGILTEHPEWAACDKNGKELSVNNGYWLCPSIPAVRRLLIDSFVELARKYPIDGMELDYIRFEVESPYQWCYNDSCRTKYKAEHGIDPMDIQPFTKQVIDWQLWREHQIDSFVEQASAELREARPNLKISAAVGSYPDFARIDLLQDWAHWADNKWVDFLAPMDYTSDPKDFAKKVDAAEERIGTKCLIAPGIGLYTTNDLAPMMEETRMAEGKPVDGVTIFASEYLSAEKLKEFADGPFKTKAALPFRAPIEGAKDLIYSVRKGLKEEASSESLSESAVDLAAAQRLIGYQLYRMKDTGYVEPTRPPIFIPEKVEPIPTVQVYETDTPPTMDGKLDGPVWKKASRVRIAETNLGEPASQPSDVFLTYDRNDLYLGVRLYDPNANDLKPKVTERDGPVFYEDSVELFFDPQGLSNSPSAIGKIEPQYFHLATNAIGTRFDQRLFDASWNGDWKVAVSSDSGYWTAEFAIPFKTLGASTPADGTIWNGNFCRNRVIPGGLESSCWSPTYGSFHTPIRFGTIRFSGKGK